ncbi:MAG: alpha/beta hydrolase [Gammaproteobacteria bacterium]|nr:alpha/beta hydrolase [Gammaproteobacteria bacterium]
MGKEAVILLHGLGRTRFSLHKIASSLKSDYRVINTGYPSRRYSIEALAEIAIRPSLEKCRDANKVHFVTHSMGGILVRQYLSNHTIDNLGNTVMLGPPNQGSELVDFFTSKPLLASIFKTVNGPAGIQLGTSANSKPNSLRPNGDYPSNFNVGIIAGSKSNNPFFDTLISGDHDGKVSVERSHLQGQTDHIVVPFDHTFMMQKDSVIDQVKAFLISGKFNH